MDSLGPRIKELRLEANLNKAALARRVGVTDVTISYWESGAIRQIGHERLVALAQALGCSLSRLLQGEERTDPLPLILHARQPPPWRDGDAPLFRLPPGLAPAARDERCYLVTPGDGEDFDFLNAGDLLAVAPTDAYQEAGLYLVELKGLLHLRRVSRTREGNLELVRADGTSDESSADAQIVARAAGRWQASPP